LEGVKVSDAFTGGCQCGAVRYTARPSVKFRSYACHCTTCQSETGSAFALQLWLLTGDLAVTGELIQGKQLKPDGATLSRFGCPDCFSRIYSVNSSRPQIITLRAGTLDDSASFTPDLHIWTRSKQPWVMLPEGALAIDTQVNTPEEWLRLLRD
jgi:hypothetical protein